MSHHCCERDENTRLTPNRQKVLALLQEAARPMSAYEVLDRLRAQGTSWQPPTVYRALERFCALGYLEKEGHQLRILDIQALLDYRDPGEEK